ncbi:hypothetical protein PC129_g22255 [Phytophthora cactorum]|uniref:Uncharacterized protein n=1 Tax=Phytophthora cactorum TaxID=29920 RepID=A0A329RGC2_9STRA|nr:hypothetical protein PC111_g21846 [Phytophthora cactorum]KAG3053466.1 hypothetical protein PC122_g22328 [Phytophthora cactorum]KAG3205070.1 hypothetical protein PC129_g22255 [Phytophthora cactorum]KAG4039781.1 hypothetical protein PC123_g24669 [Phytophthora cactorum]RAW23735.1 hypothetical protein PC110_g19835 [Phytophthora cactorum]
MLEHLSCLSSADFYQELAAWEGTVEIGLNDSKADATTMANGGGDDRCDERELGSFSASDLSGVMETVRLMDGLEGCMPTTDGCTDTGNASESNDEIPPRQLHH